MNDYRCVVGECDFKTHDFDAFLAHSHTPVITEQQERARQIRERIQFGVRLSPEELQDLAASMMTQANAEAEARARKRGNGPDVELRTGPEMLAALKLALDINAVSKAEAKPMLRKLLGKRGKEPKRGKQPTQLRRKGV